MNAFDQIGHMSGNGFGISFIIDAEIKARAVAP